MKTKKTVKRLKKVEALLAAVIDRCGEDDAGIQKMLHEARTSVVRAKRVVRQHASANAPKKPPAKASSTKQGQHGTRRVARDTRKAG